MFLAEAIEASFHFTCLFASLILHLESCYKIVVGDSSYTLDTEVSW